MASPAVDLTSFGALIRERRKTLRLTQSELAERLGWSQERISVVENGKYGMPSLPTTARLAEALELPFSVLLEAMGYPVAGGALAEGRRAPAQQTAVYQYTLQRLLEIDASTLKDALDEASDQMAGAMGAEKVDAFICDRATKSLVALGTSNTPMGRLQHSSGLDRLPLANGGRTVEVYRTGAAFRTGNARNDPDVLLGVKETLGVQSMLAVPLQVDRDITGVLVAQSTDPDRFGDDDQQFFAAAARWIGLIARRAEAAETTRQMVADETKRETADELIAALAHDLRDLLTPLTGRIDLLRRDLSKAELEGPLHHANEAWRSLTTIQQMVSSLLDSARLEQGLFSLALQPVDLAELIRSVVEDMRASWQALEVRAAEPLLIEGDPIRLREVLVNLLTNASRHSPKGTPIRITARTEARENARWAVVSIEDQGPGIEPEALPRLFERFAPGRGSTGLGLGLYLAHRLVDAHGGTLTVDSTLGQGTTFWLSLPLTDT